MLDFKPLDPNAQGLYTVQDKLEYAASQSLECLLITFREMNDLVQKSFLFDPEKKNQLYVNNSEQITLRVQLEQSKERIF